MAEKPRVLVIEREASHGEAILDKLGDDVDVVSVRSISKALALLRDGRFAGVYVDASQLAAARWVGMIIQAEEILDAIADGVAVVDPDLRIIWANPEFLSFTMDASHVVGERFYQVLVEADILGPEPCPFTTSVASRQPSSTVVKIRNNRYLRVTVTPVFDAKQILTHLIALTREITDETQQQLKVNAIAQAGDELADLTPEELSSMGVEERTDLLKFNIARHMKDLMGLDYIEIRLLDRASGRLVPLLTEGMTPLAATRELSAAKEGQGVTGLVAATGQSYLCPDTTKDPYYLEGAENARSSLTVPLVYHGNVIGTLNVESGQPDAFDDRDRQFLEIYGRNVASALNTLELLQAEKASTANASVQAISREVALPLDDVITDAVTVLDRYAGHDEDVIARLRHLLYRAREIREIIQKMGTTLAPAPAAGRPAVQPAARLAGARLLVVDADESIRRSAHQLLGMQGAVVETARDAREAVALARQESYSATLADIRLPDMDGYAIFKRLREVRPDTPVILMTGFGYDPTHSIVKARQEGLQTVLYKPFRSDRLMEAVEQALHIQTNNNNNNNSAEGRNSTEPAADGHTPAAT
ncbi:response regulator [Paludisphaera rhizosphaerae]|uniref:response regulator n=1 Tax=Paludisphaera rhizosphaerae TaxID=2711216 RepID=UPI0013E9B0C8|nr:response regulator [Paludisphaera rhizosphaerae]